MRFRSFWRDRTWRNAIVFAFGVALLTTSLAVYDELGGSSTLQARNFHRLSREAGFHVAPGRSPSIRFPGTGPLDQRLGYVELPRFLERLDAQGCPTASQARWSPRLSTLSDWGLFPPYREETQTGLQIRDRHGTTITAMRYPERVFQRFEDIPRLIVDTLLFIENRELFDDEHPKRNPAIEIDRLCNQNLGNDVHAEDKRSNCVTYQKVILALRVSSLTNLWQQNVSYTYDIVENVNMMNLYIAHNRCGSLMTTNNFCKMQKSTHGKCNIVIRE